MEFVFWLQFATTWAMIGANVFVYVVHYPGFEFYKGDNFEAIERFHIQRTLKLAIPVLLIEAITALILLVFSFHWLFIINAIIVGMIMFLTFGKCVPIHFKMAKENTCNITIEHLKKFHLARVILWIGSGILLFFAAAPFCLHH